MSERFTRLEVERVKKIYYQIERKVCPNCQKILSGKVKNAFPRVSMSNELVVELAEQHYWLGRSLGQITERFGLSYATVSESLHRIGEKLKPHIEKLKELFRRSEVRHADETGWRTDGGNGYAGYFGSAEMSLYLFRQTRSARVVEEVFGKELLKGVVVVDQYAGYNARAVFDAILLCPVVTQTGRFSQRFPQESGASKLHWTDEKAVESSDEIEKRRIERSQISAESQAHQRANLEVKQSPSQTSGGQNLARFLCRKSGKIISKVSKCEDTGRK